MKLEAAFLRQLEDLLAEFKDLRARSKYDDVSDLPEADVIRFVTRARAAIHRLAGPASPYVLQCEEILKEKAYPGFKARQLVGVLRSLHADIEAGYLQSASELIRGEVFGDFLEMADHLADQGYKDAAAVVGGSALEAHLRHLCHRAGITVDTTGTVGHRPKKAEALNTELAQAGAYSKP